MKWTHVDADMRGSHSPKLCLAIPIIEVKPMLDGSRVTGANTPFLSTKKMVR